MQVRRDWDLPYDVDDVLRSQGADPDVLRDRRPQIVALSERALAVGRDLTEPVVLTRSLTVEGSDNDRVTLEGGVELTGPLVTHHLSTAESVVVLLCSVGAAVTTAAARESADNPTMAFALDAVGSAAVLSLTAAACNQVERHALSNGWKTSLPLSPGMDGWAVDPGQREVFAAIDPSPLGVVLSTELEMWPLKTTTTVIGIGPDIATHEGICDHCDLRFVCRHKISLYERTGSNQ